MKMTFELFVYRAQMFAVKLQQSKPGTFVTNLKIGFGGIVTQFLMGIAFAKCYAEGERQWRKQKNNVNTKKNIVRTTQDNGQNRKK